MQDTSERKHARLIVDVLQKAVPSDKRAKELVSIADFKNATAQQIDAICDCLLGELTGSELDTNSEPTRRGLEIEDAIDWLRNPR